MLLSVRRAGERQAVDETPFLDLRSAVFGTGVPSRIRVYEDGIEVSTLKPPRRLVQRVRYEQIAQVFVVRRIFYADLVIETRGGDKLTIAGIDKHSVEAARALILERLDMDRPTPIGDAAPSSIPDQIRQLAELRDAGILSEGEFETKKAELLKRL
jgi:hypothetical protein